MSTRIIRRLGRALVLMFLILLMGTSFAQKTETKEEGKKDATTLQTAVTVATKTISGQVGVIRPGYITIIYKEETLEDGTVKDWEMVLPYDKTLTLEHKKGLDQIKEGDTIEIVYYDSGWVDDKGVGRSEKKAKHIRFIRSAPEGLSSGGN